jgi:hypothetical protein
MAVLVNDSYLHTQADTTHCERNTVQHWANQRKEDGLDIRGLQLPANPCDTWIITRSWSRGKRFESARLLSKKLQF